MSIEKIEVIVGCEIHVQVDTKSKAFCACENRYGGLPNSRVCPTCLALPGALPRVNSELIDHAILAGLALGCTVAPLTKFDRKHYVYPDLPKGYQISQYDVPICEHGHLDIETAEGSKKIGIIRLHMEEDAGKNLHIDDKSSYVDYNRCGAPLIEIVSAPDMRSPEEAVAYVSSIREIMRFLGVSDCNMEEGSLRCDANINLWIYEDGKKFATPIAEIKNMNSFKAMKSALAFEVERQTKAWNENHITLQMKGKETRGYDEKTGGTLLQRTKEEAADYRYFPEPDLKPIIISEALVEGIRKGMGELPRAMRERFKASFDFSPYDVEVLTSSKALAIYFEETVKGYAEPKKAANWILSEVLAAMNERALTIETFPIKPDSLRALFLIIDSGEISGKIAKEVFLEMIESGKEPKDIVSSKGLKQESNTDAIASIIEAVIQENPKAIEDYKKGKSNAVTFLMGQVMKKSKGQANPQISQTLMNERLARLM